MWHDIARLRKTSVYQINDWTALNPFNEYSQCREKLCTATDSWHYGTLALLATRALEEQDTEVGLTLDYE